MEKMYLNRGWNYNNCEVVDIPHMGCQLPYNYVDENEYQLEATYSKEIFIAEENKGKKLLLTFLGVAHMAKVFINGELAGTHKCGYTAFTMDISELIKYGENNLILVEVDSRESLNIPPFGNVIDYLTYQGIYRDVYLEIKDPSYIKDVIVQTKGNVLKTLTVCSSEYEGIMIEQYVYEKGDESVKYQLKTKKADTIAVDNKIKIDDVKLWDTDNPNLYVLVTNLIKNEVIVDTKEITFGFRDIKWTKKGFYLNGNRIKIRGLNRHQSYPYVGYAMPKSMQVMDARILKEELSLNAVRTSHYPQSQDFIDECDRLGLLVFTEIPGWQHIGDEEWQDIAVENVKEMVCQYRNHPSIILWGVRINESEDNDKLYTRTNEMAKKHDDTRATGGVRYITDSNLLEDVYTFNDFSHEGDNAGITKRSKVTKNSNAPYLVTEYNGHMFPTKSFDNEDRRLEHALRHARVVNDYSEDGNDVAGGFGWCMTDYNTHKEFGSGDKICHHGVMDMFRNPKLAAAFYASQCEDKVVCEVSSSMDIGEHNAGGLGDIYVFTNADSIKLYKNDRFIYEYECKNYKYNYLKHPPVLIDDLIGNSLEEDEGFSHSDAVDIKKVLVDYSKHSMNLPLLTKLLAGKLMMSLHLTFKDAERLYKKYVGNWGGNTTVYKFEAIKNDQVVKTIIKEPVMKVSIVCDVSHTELVEDHTYDVAAIRIRAVDNNGNVLPYYNEPLVLEASEGVKLIGPSIISLKGGMGGTYVKSVTGFDKGSLRIKGNNVEDINIEFSIRSADNE